MSEPEPPRTKARLPFGERPTTPGGGALRRIGPTVYGVLMLGLAGLAGYMHLVQDHALTSAYVVAPGVGALWFALRLFMTLAPR